MPSRPAQRLRSHLEATYAIEVETMADLDVGVWRVGRADGPDWVARWFPARRPFEAVAGDAEILSYLAAHDFPAERCAVAEVAAASRMLAGAAHIVSDDQRSAYEELCPEVGALDAGDGLPEALTTPTSSSRT